MSARKNHGSIRPPKESLSDTNSTHNASNLIQSVIKSDNIDQNLSKLSKLKVIPSEKTKFPSETLEKAVTALNCIPSDLERNDWLKIGTALKSEFGDSAKSEFLSWSDNGKSADRSNAKSTWRSIQAGRVNISTLYWYARQYGYTEERQQVSSADYAKQQQAQAERKARQASKTLEAQKELEAGQQRAQTAINEVTPFLVPATPRSTLYLKNKQSDGQGAYILHCVDINKTETARNTYPFSVVKKGALFIPFQSNNGEYVGAQLIANGLGKINVKGSIKKNAYAYVGLAPLPQATDTIYITEGYATANSALQANAEAFAVMAIDSGNLPLVAELIRKRYQHANIIILADNDKSGAGQAKAKEARQYANNVLIPDWIEGQIKSTDFNDMHVIKGIDALRNVLNTPKVIQTIEAISLQSNDLEPPAWLNDAPPMDDNSDQKKPAPVLENLLSKAISEKLNQLGLNELSHTQTRMVKQAVLANYKPSQREWLRAPSPQYLELIETPNYKDAYQKIKIALANGESEITVSHRYALESMVAAYDLGIELLLLDFDMNSGKSWGYGWMVANHPAIKKDTGSPTCISACHLESINTSNATARNNDDAEEDIKAGKAPWCANHADYHNDDFAKIDSVHTTINSLKSVKNKAQITDIDVSLFDETEGMANFISSDALPRRWGALKELRDTISDTDFTILTDAHAGAVTDRFIQLLTNKPVFTVKSDFKVWEHVNGYLIDDLSGGVRQVIKELKKAMKNGDAVASFFASAAEAKVQHKKIKDKLDLTDEQFPLITSKTRAIEWVVELKANPKLFDKVVGFVASPSLGIGISIETEKFKTAFLFASNSDRVGDANSQLQMPFRIRNIKSLYYVRCASEDMEGRRENLEQELLEILKTKARGEFILANTIDTSDVQDMVASERRNAQTNLYDYDMDLRAFYIADCLQRFDKIEASLKRKGINLIPLEVWVSEFDVLANGKLRAAIKTETLERQLATTIITADEAKAIVKDKRKNHNKISTNNADKLTVYTIAKNLISEKSIDERVPAEAIKAYEKGAVVKRDRLQRAITHKSRINKIVKAHAFGAKDGKLTRLKKDLADTSPEKMLLDYEYDKYLISLINVTKDNQGYVDSIKGVINLDNANPRTKNKIQKELNELISKRNALKVNGNLETKVVKSELSRQIKNKITNRMGVKFKAKSKMPFIEVPKKRTCPDYLLPVLGAVFGTTGKKIESKIVTAESMRVSGMIELLTDEVRKQVNKDSKYKITKANAKKQPLRALKRLLDVAGIDYKKGKKKNGYSVAKSEYDAQHLADIAREKQHNNIAELSAYIDSIGLIKN